MAEKEVEDDDPFEFVAVRYPVEPGVDADYVMARCFVEDYALLGTPRSRIAQLFRSPFFAGTYGIAQDRGIAFVESIIDEVFGAVRAEEGS